MILRAFVIYDRASRSLPLTFWVEASTLDLIKHGVRYELEETHRLDVEEIQDELTIRVYEFKENIEPSDLFDVELYKVGN